MYCQQNNGKYDQSNEGLWKIKKKLTRTQRTQKSKHKREESHADHSTHRLVGVSCWTGLQSSRRCCRPLRTRDTCPLWRRSPGCCHSPRAADTQGERCSQEDTQGDGVHRRTHRETVFTRGHTGRRCSQEDTGRRCSQEDTGRRCSQEDIHSIHFCITLDTSFTFLKHVVVVNLCMNVWCGLTRGVSLWPLQWVYLNSLSSFYVHMPV